MAHVIIVGRAPDCSLVLADASVSGRHARLSWRNGLVQVEDLASANGTWVNGQRVELAAVRPGDDVRLGSVALPWSRRELRAFLREGAKGTALLGADGAPDAGRIARLAASVVFGALAFVGAGIAAAWFARPGSQAQVQAVITEVTAATGLVDAGPPARSEEESAIRQRTAAAIREAIDPTNPVTRNAAVRLAAQEQGTFRVEQVAAIWGYVREHWRYVNDPNGREYFAAAHETIANGYAGDCDDFAITLAAMVGAIGGATRVIVMEGPAGGHAYTEACIRETPTVVATKLAQHYGRAWARYVPGGRRQIAFRTDADCPVWLNLDWNASVPGGDYVAEQWAVAVYPDGHTETLAAAGHTHADGGAVSQPRALATPPFAP